MKYTRFPLAYSTWSTHSSWFGTRLGWCRVNECMAASIFSRNNNLSLSNNDAITYVSLCEPAFASATDKCLDEIKFYCRIISAPEFVAIEFPDRFVTLLRCRLFRSTRHFIRGFLPFTHDSSFLSGYFFTCSLPKITSRSLLVLFE